MLGKLIRNILVNDTDVSAIVGTNVYPQMAIEDVPYPYIIIEQENNSPTDTKDGVSCLDVIESLFSVMCGFIGDCILRC